MSNPTVSFVLPVYNAQETVVEAVNSVLAQTYTDFELILIDDGSKDASLALLSQFKDPRIRLLTQENRGLATTLNRGITEARGTWIARMDNDDICLPTRLASQMKFLADHPDVALLGGWISTMDEAGELLAEVVTFPETHDELWRGLGTLPWAFCHPAVVFRRDAAIELGLYDASFKHAEEIELFAKFMTRYKAATVPEVVLRYRLRRGASSGAFQDHGNVNKELIRQRMKTWKPGESFSVTADDRAEADRKIVKGNSVWGANAVESAYHCRCGREYLRGARWAQAMAAYARAIPLKPLQVTPYRGIAAALLRVGAAPSKHRHEAAALLKSSQASSRA